MDPETPPPNTLEVIVGRMRSSGSSEKRPREQEGNGTPSSPPPGQSKRRKIEIRSLKNALGERTYQLLLDDVDTVCKHVAWLSEEDAKRALLTESKIQLPKCVTDKKDVFERTLVYNYRRALLFRIATFDNRWVHAFLTSKNSPLKKEQGKQFYERVYKTLFDANF